MRDRAARPTNGKETVPVFLGSRCTGTVGFLISPRLASATARMRGPRMRGPRMQGLDERGTANASASYRRGRYSPRLGLLDGVYCCCPTDTRTRTRRAWGTWQKAASVIIVFVIVLFYFCCCWQAVRVLKFFLDVLASPRLRLRPTCLCGTSARVA